MYQDPSGNFIDVVLDVGFIAYDIYKIYKDPNSGGNWAALAADVLCAVKGAGETGNNLVYLSKNADGVTQYVGITNNIARRQAEHLASKGIEIEPLMKNLSRSDARAVEQALIEIHGLGKNGGTLINKINSIGKTNPQYAKSLERGYELLKSIGY